MKRLFLAIFLFLTACGPEIAPQIDRTENVDAGQSVEQVPQGGAESSGPIEQPESGNPDQQLCDHAYCDRPEIDVRTQVTLPISELKH